MYVLSRGPYATSRTANSTAHTRETVSECVHPSSLADIGGGDNSLRSHVSVWYSSVMVARH